MSVQTGPRSILGVKDAEGLGKALRSLGTKCTGINSIKIHIPAGMNGAGEQCLKVRFRMHGIVLTQPSIERELRLLAGNYTSMTVRMNCRGKPGFRGKPSAPTDPPRFYVSVAVLVEKDALDGLVKWFKPSEPPPAPPHVCPGGLDHHTDMYDDPHDTP
jgi:hypothetical protein